MPRVAKDRRLKRKARLARRAAVRQRFVAHMAAHAPDWQRGGWTEYPDGSVTYRGDGSVIDCANTGGVAFRC